MRSRRSVRGTASSSTGMRSGGSACERRHPAPYGGFCHVRISMSEQERSELIARLAKLETAGFSDVLDEMGYPNQVLASDLRPLDPERRLAGIAFCVRGENRVVTQTPMPPDQQLSPYELERQMKPGLVAVIDAGGHSIGATIGGFVATSLKSSGCQGLVTNGGVRDSREIVAVGLPTFCRF